MPDRAAQSEYLLQPAFLRKLEQATIASRHALAGRGKGERRSPRRGTSVEFSDFRAYAPGDDLRYLDWNAYARLRRLFLKLFVDEEDLQVHLLVDTSGSMDFGSPSKLDWARQAAAALCYLGLCGGDRVTLYGYAEGRFQRSRVFRGRGCAAEAFEWLLRLEPSGRTALRTGTDYLVRGMSGPGLVFVLSDLLTEDWEAALGSLAVCGGEACVLHVMAAEEISPSGSGDLELVDAETGETREITMGASVLRRYAKERDAFLQSVRGACFRYGFPYLFEANTTPVADAILRSLRRLGVIQ
jgi:uncharacterized protein (DUF58 family)